MQVRLLLLAADRLPLQDLEVRPQDVAHEEWRPRDELLLVQAAKLFAGHCKASQKGVHLVASEAAQGKLPDGPSQPVPNLLSAPASRVTRDPELCSNSIPCTVCASQQLTHRGGSRRVEGGAVHLLLDVVNGAGGGGGVVRLHGVAVQAVCTHG